VEKNQSQQTRHRRGPQTVGDRQPQGMAASVHSPFSPPDAAPTPPFHHRAPRYQPTPVPGLEGEHISEVACGWRHSIAITSTGQLYTFGWWGLLALRTAPADDPVMRACRLALAGRLTCGDILHTHGFDQPRFPLSLPLTNPNL
jgi:hypothetical protein